MENQGDYELKTKLEGLDGVICLSDEKNIAGEITLIGNDIQGEVWDVKLTDYDEGKTRECERFGITTSNERYNIANAGSSHYSLEFKFETHRHTAEYGTGNKRAWCRMSRRCR